VPAHAAVPGPPRKTALLDASAKVQELRTSHAGNPAALADALAQLDAAHLPHPAVRQNLVGALVAAGRQDEAVATARDAIPQALRSGSVAAAAVMFEALLATEDGFGLTKDQTLSIADALRGLKRVPAAVEIYSRVLRADPADMKAMKGSIAIAQQLAHDTGTAAEAVRIYDRLIAQCPASPLIDFVKAEREKAIRS
jgi:tetratricopeptide (TPR) repeat protein